jgi:hypothetical protein
MAIVKIKKQQHLQKAVLYILSFVLSLLCVFAFKNYQSQERYNGIKGQSSLGGQKRAYKKNVIFTVPHSGYGRQIVEKTEYNSEYNTGITKISYKFAAPSLLEGDGKKDYFLFDTQSNKLKLVIDRGRNQVKLLFDGDFDNGFRNYIVWQLAQ